MVNTIQKPFSRMANYIVLAQYLCQEVEVVIHNFCGFVIDHI